MKHINKLIAAAIVVFTLVFTACVDDIKFGNAFLDKASGSTVTKDTVFNSAIYTQQFLNSIYSMQYYGLPFASSTTGMASSADTYTGKWEALTDCIHDNWSSSNHYSTYYNGTHTASYGYRGDKFCFIYERVWECVRACLILLENVDEVPDLSESEKTRMKAETKCIIAARYFDMFRHYGGLPLMYESFTGNESSYDCPRATVEETVNYMLNWLDEAINSGGMPWAYGDGADGSSTYVGRWSTGSAMALKCKILQFAASPLFNDTQGYYGGGSEAEQQHLVWYGGYKPELWTQCYQACKEFFDAVDSKGFYKLWQVEDAAPSTTNVGAQYRYTYRMAYIKQDSHEVVQSVRYTSTDAFNSSTYNWHTWQQDATTSYNVERLNYSASQEYIEMFPWADGRPFDWDDLEKNGDLDTMFFKGDQFDATTNCLISELTRDPRLYETQCVNGQSQNLDWTTGEMTGDAPYELYIGGRNALNEPITQTGRYGTGYGNMKYFLGTEYQREFCQWVYLRFSDLMLTYAEAALQANNDFTTCIKYIDEVRARVGLKGIVQCNPDKNLTSNKENLLEELLRERACELGMEDVRFFDLIRYKKKDRFELQLHGLLIHRLDEDGNNYDYSWYGQREYQTMHQPTHFSYEKFEITSPVRYWWKYGFDAKWYLSPIPQTEINKDYGLIQNPGW